MFVLVLAWLVQVQSGDRGTDALPREPSSFVIGADAGRFWYELWKQTRRHNLLIAIHDVRNSRGGREIGKKR